MEKLLVGIKAPGSDLTFGQHSNDLESLRELVGGNLEAVKLPQGIWLWVNEDGKVDDLPINLAVFVDTDFEPNRLVDVVHGRAFFSGATPDGQTCSLSVKQMDWLRSHIKMMETEHEGTVVYQLHWEAWNPVDVYG